MKLSPPTSSSGYCCHSIQGNFSLALELGPSWRPGPLKKLSVVAARTVRKAYCM
jgi:hypothetical protein